MKVHLARPANMRSVPYFIFYLLFCLCPLTLSASDLESDKARMMADLDIIKNEIDINYAPAEWKKKYCDWDLDTALTQARETIQGTQNLTSKGFHQILRNLFNSLKDLHVNVNFYTTEFAVLPFLVQGVNQRYFVVWVNDKWKESKEVPLEIGDEILSFNGQPITEILKELHTLAYGSSDSETYQRLGELLLTVRDGDALLQIPQGQVEIEFKKSQQKKASTFVTEWKYVPEEIDQCFLPPYIQEENDLGSHPFFHKRRTLPLYTRWQKYHPDSIYGSQWLGGKRSPFPPLGPITWKSNSKAFDAYIYSLNGRSIGYVRIPDFHGEKEEYEEFREIIATMQGRTKTLVIDIMNNPGGYAYYTYGLLSMLTDKPLVNLKEEFSITQQDVFFALDDIACLTDLKSDEEAMDVLGPDICGFPVDLKFAQSIVKMGQFIKEQYRQGKYITEPYPSEGLEVIHPHPTTRYTKPIIVLTNSLSISCGDLFPAILQDNKRAKILGSQTGGAGGYVLSRKYSNRFGVANFTLTGSLIHRLDGQPLENLGVTPDIAYQLSEEDYTHNYSNFIKFVNKSVNKLNQ